MTQSRRASLAEACLNTGSGFAISFVLWQLVGPLMGYHVTLADNFILTTIFTVVSVGRSYVWRRIFNRRRTS